MSLILATVVPSFLILAFFIFSDKFREPTQSIIKVFLYGVLITIPVFVLNTAFGDYFYNRTNASELLIGSFLTAAPIEEGFKFLVLYFLVYKMKDFNEPMDGIVYGVCVALGFATLENFYYVYFMEFENTTPMALAYLRAFSAVPAHALDGLFMGYFFMKYVFVRKKDNLFFSFFVPFLLHGFYNLFAGINLFMMFCLLIGGWIIGLRLFFKLKKVQNLKKKEYQKRI